MDTRDQSLLHNEDQEEQTRIQSNSNWTHFVAFLLDVAEGDGVGEGDPEIIGVGAGVT
jgi:hypothetical protein